MELNDQNLKDAEQQVLEYSGIKIIVKDIEVKSGVKIHTLIAG